jgi:tetratricopeptide (TPR) repeat protein
VKRDVAVGILLLTVSVIACCGVPEDDAHAGMATGEAGNALVDDSRFADLIMQLGDPDYGRRQAATQELEQLGGAAIDQLLEAAEQSSDLEITLRAKWLVHSIPLSRPHDTPVVIQLLDSYKLADLSDRVAIMHSLLRLDDAAGIEPLARLLRLEQSPAAAVVAAALLVREWSPEDAFFRGMIPLIRDGIGSSQRPAAMLVRAVADFADGQPTAMDAILAAREQLSSGSTEAATMPVPPLNASDDASDLSGGLEESTNRIFDQLVLQALIAAGRIPEAVELAEVLLEKARAAPGDDAAVLLAWCTERGLPEVVDRLTFSPAGTIDDDIFLTFAAAVALNASGQADRGLQTAAAASRLAKENSMDRLQAAVMLAKWGATEWADREYAAILGNPQAPSIEFVLSAVMFSEFLHDQGREDEAAKALAEIFRPRPGENVDPNTVLRQLSREPASTRSRMLYFEAAAAAARGNLGMQRQKLEESVRTSPKDVDALIALHGLTDATPLQKKAVRQQIDAALAQIEREIATKPEEPNGYNEYAWLAANTVDEETPHERLTKATRYSKRSLEISFDSASYLDTLAHCHAAEGNFDRAIRAQTLAARYEPHNLTIQRNLARFREQAAEAGR